MAEGTEPVSRERDLIHAALEEARRLGARGPRSGIATDTVPGYEILREVHRGGQGVVYEAIQHSTRRRVAIKFLREGVLADSRQQARFEREVQVLSELSHPNIVVIQDAGAVNGVQYHVMDLVEGLPLDSYLAWRTPDTLATLELFGKICTAVNAAHLHGVIHRDLKPANILIDEAGEPHILDFGLAKLAGDDADSAGAGEAMTLTGQFLGSLPWASPEQAEGAPEKIDVRTDVYSLGVMLYQALTGRFPYEVAGNMRDVLDNILRAQPPRPSTASGGRRIKDEIETIVLKCLSKERERRYQSAGELGRDIGRFLSGEPIEAKRDSALYVLRKTMARHRMKASVAAGFLLLIVASSIALAFMYQSAQAAAHLAALQRDRAEDALRKSLATTGVLAGVMDIIDDARVSADPIAVLDEASSSVGVTFAALPEEESELRYALAIGYYRADKLATDPTVAMIRAIREARAALEIRRRVFGPEHPATVRSMVQLAGILDMSQRFTEAESLASSVAEIARARSEVDGEELVVALNLRAAIQRDSGRLAEALVSAREALAAAEEHLSPTDTKIVQMRKVLIQTLCLVQQFGEAESLIGAWYGWTPGDGEALNELPLTAIMMLMTVHAASGRQWEAALLHQRYTERFQARLHEEEAAWATAEPQP